MKCPECGNECRKGVITFQHIERSLPFHTTMNWYADSKSIDDTKKEMANLYNQGDGFYCDECMKVYAVFEEVPRWNLPIEYFSCDRDY